MSKQQGGAAALLFAGPVTDAATAAEASATARPQRVAGALAHRDRSEDLSQK